MPSIHLDPTKKGLVQKTGNVVSGDTMTDVTLQTIGAAGTISTAGKGMLIRVDAGGGARADVAIEKGTVDGQIVVIVNVGGEALTMNANAAVSFVALANACVIAAGASLFCVYDSTTARWYTTET